MIKYYLFYLNLLPDNKGRMIEDYILADDIWWERTHDFIQWAFPNERVSDYNKNAPKLTWYLKLFLKNKVSKNYHRRLLDRADTFFKFYNPQYIIVRGGHNHLRISRILHFCKDTGHVFPNLEQFMNEAEYHANIIGSLSVKTYKYWRDIYNEICKINNGIGGKQ